MAASKFAEKLIILCDHATGIQARLYQLVDYKKPALFAKDSEIEKFARLFLKKVNQRPTQHAWSPSAVRSSSPVVPFLFSRSVSRVPGRSEQGEA
jgi:hypothetical protein